MRLASGTLIALTLLQGACSSPGLPERYAHCSDLGTLRLAAHSADEAEDRMRAQVAIIGGDMLLFNAQGHAEDGSAVPTALTQRRNVLAPAESRNGKQPELARLVASTAATETEQQLWYYGAALRCAGNRSQPERSPAPLQ